MRQIAVILLSAMLLMPVSVCQAQEKPRWLQAIEYLMGFSAGKLRVKGSYRAIPLMVDFDLNLKPLTQKINFNPPALLQFQIEPFISSIYEPAANVEMGVSFFLKIGLLPQTSKFQPYLKAGAGMEYMSLHTKEQGTQFNFIEPGGIGMHYFFRKNLGLTLEGRYRHLSNADIDDRNSGINTYFILTGITYQF